MAGIVFIEYMRKVVAKPFDENYKNLGIAALWTIPKAVCLYNYIICITIWWKHGSGNNMRNSRYQKRWLRVICISSFISMKTSLIVVDSWLFASWKTTNLASLPYKVCLPTQISPIAKQNNKLTNSVKLCHHKIVKSKGLLKRKQHKSLFAFAKLDLNNSYFVGSDWDFWG